jgi:GNAT superfamily N-acetyltransferase
VCLASFPSVISVVRAGAERIDQLEPLWRALYSHHVEVGRDVAPVRTLEASWRRRRPLYQRWLRGDDAVLLIAEREGRAVGYAMLTVGAGPATWDLGEHVVELETLAVLPEERGAGVGHALIAEAERVAREWGAGALAVGLVHTNEGARRFYEREGFGPFYLEMVRDLRRE